MTHTSLTQNLNLIVTAARNELAEPPKLDHESDWIDQAYLKTTQLALRDVVNAHAHAIRLHPQISGCLVGPTDFSAVLRWAKEFRLIGREGNTVHESFRIARSGWNGNGMYAYVEGLGTDTPHFTLFTAQKLHQRGWLPSQADLFASDWIVLYTPEMEGTPDVEEV